MKQYTEPIEKLDLDQYLCFKYWIDDDYKPNRIIIRFYRQPEGWLCERKEFIQHDVCDRKKIGELIKIQTGIMDEEQVIEIINNFIEHTTLTIALEYAVWGYDGIQRKEYAKRMYHKQQVGC